MEQAWNITGLWSPVQKVMDEAESFREGIFALLNLLDDNSRKKVAMVIWALWKRRNDKVWNGIVQPMDVVVRGALDFLADWSVARVRAAATATLQTAATSLTATAAVTATASIFTTACAAATAATASIFTAATATACAAATAATATATPAVTATAAIHTAATATATATSSTTATAAATHTNSAFEYECDSNSRMQDADFVWKKPAAGTFKCNVDAALFENENKYGIGICIRNDSGNFYKGKTLWYDGLPSPQEAEAMGLWQALLWLRDLGLSFVSIELDCLSVVNGVQEDANTYTEFGTLMSYCQNFLSTFVSFKVSFIRRQANRAAHTLARVSRFRARSTIYDHVPTCIDSIIINEMR